MANCVVSTGNSNGVNVRSAKVVSSSNLLGVIDNGVSVNIVRCDDTWATLMYQGTPAFLQHQFLLNPPTTNGDGLDTSSNNTAVCNGDNVNIRSTANRSTTGNTLDKGDSVTIYQKSLVGGYYWYRIGSNQWDVAISLLLVALAAETPVVVPSLVMVPSLMVLFTAVRSRLVAMITGDGSLVVL